MSLTGCDAAEGAVADDVSLWEGVEEAFEEVCARRDGAVAAANNTSQHVPAANAAFAALDINAALAPTAFRWILRMPDGAIGLNSSICPAGGRLQLSSAECGEARG